MRRRFQIAIERTKPEVTIYHYGGSDPALLADLDGASRRILDLTCNFPKLDSWIQPPAHLFDGILSVNQSACKIAQKALPNWDRSRIQWWPQPILPPSNLQRSPKPSKPLALGYAGRIIHPQKRVERIPQICRLLDERQTPFRFEFLGDGAERPALERFLPQRPQFLFHGIRQGNDYWQILANWDVILLTSDHEGVPRVILEGMSLGVIPVVPKIDAEADRYAHSIDPRLCYKPADIKSAADAIERLAKLPEAELANLRRQCRQMTQKHLDGKAYRDTFQTFVRAVQKMPRISEIAPPRNEQFDDVPFRWLQRIGKFRATIEKSRNRLAKLFHRSSVNANPQNSPATQ